MKKTMIISTLVVLVILLALPQPTVSLSMAIVKVTAYSHKGRTASGVPVRDGIVALSRDIEKLLDLDFGDQVRLEGLGTYTFHDRLAGHKRRQADIWVSRPGQAIKFGVRHNVLLLKIV